MGEAGTTKKTSSEIKHNVIIVDVGKIISGLKVLAFHPLDIMGRWMYLQEKMPTCNGNLTMFK